MKYFLILFLLSVSCLANGQHIKGHVLEKTANGEVALSGANVCWLGTTQGTLADEKGNFKLAWNQAGRLVVSFIGYVSDTVEVSSPDREIRVQLRSGQQLDEVRVVGRRPSTIISTRGPVIEQLITGEELTKAACCNLGESFETNASVDVSYADAVTGAKQIQLLGLTGKYVQMMTEKLPNFRGLSSLYGLSYVPGPWMDGISVSKGIGSVENGYEAIAGQISVGYKKPLSEKLYVNVYGNSENMYEFNADAGIKLNDKWSTMVLLHGDWLKMSHDVNHDGFMDMPEKSQYNVMNRWAYQDESWFLQFGAKLLDEDRVGGQVGFEKNMRKYVPDTTALYGIGIRTRRYEGFLKLGYLMPQYEHTTMALLANYSDHDQDSYFGLRDYRAGQRTVYLNYIYQSVFGNSEDQKYSAGISFNYDRYNEFLGDYVIADGGRLPFARLKRNESVPGIYFQYTGKFWDEFTVMAGIRYDHNNIYGGFWTPRLHLMYVPDELTTIKLSGGKGYRTSNILAENSYMFASARSVYVNNKLLADEPGELSRLDMEEAWNFGVSVNRKFIVFDRVFNINADYFRTDFVNQVIADNETQAGKINFYNLDGVSYSNCYQIEVKYEVLPRLDITGAYRYNDAQTTIGGVKKRTALMSKYKGLLNLSYFTHLKKWQFDFTTQFNGSGRIPLNYTEEYKSSGRFDAYRIMNAQVTKYFRQWSVYAGCENIGNFRQREAIVAADRPWNENFDASRIWGPLNGRKFYLGFRFGLDRN